MALEGGAPTLAPIFNANLHKQWIYDDTMDSLIKKDIQFIPIFFKNFDEVYNNGRGILVEINKEEKVYILELIFGHLLTLSNYDDSKKKVVCGNNGYGAKLCKTFSIKFIVETARKESSKKYYQKFSNYMSVIRPPKMNQHNADIVGPLKEVSMFLNDSKLKLNSFKDYIQMYLKITPGPDVEDLTKRIGLNGLGQLQQVSFVNSISTSKGGTYVNYVVDAIVKLIREALVKKKLKSKILPGVIKSNMWIFVNCQIDNLSFDSQIKENMTLKPSSFGSHCELTEKFQVGVLKSGIIYMLTALSQAKDNMAMVKALDSTKSGCILGNSKLEDANKAGT
ncbi:DNA topoisomerase 2 [Massospora cicadina]|nr:DNA topoisomerase 2 [Massospora cicadina]